MADGSAAKLYVTEHQRDIHPATGKQPVIVGELIYALRRGDLEAADALAQNFVEHGSIRLPDVPTLPAAAKR